MKEKIGAMIEKTLAHELISGSFYMFLGSIIGNILAFIFNFFLIRKLSDSDYGIYASLISLITLSTIPSVSFSTIIVQFATDYFTKKQIGKARSFYRFSFKVAVVVSILFVASFVFFSSGLGSFLHVDSTSLIILAGITIAFTYIGVVNGSYSQSLLQFKFLSIYQIITGLIKLGFGIALLWVGYRVFGAIWAVLLSFFLPFLIGFLPVRFMLEKQTEKITIHTREILNYSIPTIIVSLALSSFTSSDILLVKHYFSPEMAGVYAKISLIGRVIFYFTSQIPLVMFPLVIKRFNKKENYQNLFYLALLIVIIPSVGITIFYYLFPGLTSEIFLGGNTHFAYSGYLWIMGLYLTVFSVLNTFVTFFLSLRTMGILYPVLLAAVVQIVGILIFHTTILSILLISIATAIVLLMILLLYYFRTYV